jgi:hypothetical protein
VRPTTGRDPDGIKAVGAFRQEVTVNKGFWTGISRKSASVNPVKGHRGRGLLCSHTVPNCPQTKSGIFVFHIDTERFDV